MLLNVYIEEFENAYTVYRQVELTKQYLNELDVDEIKNDVIELQNITTTLQQNISTINTSLSTLTSTTSNLQNQIGEINEIIDDLNNNVIQLQQNLDDYNTRLTNLENKFNKIVIQEGGYLLISSIPKGVYICVLRNNDENAGLIYVSNENRYCITPNTVITVDDNNIIGIVHDSHYTVDYLDYNNASKLVTDDYDCELYPIGKF